MNDRQRALYGLVREIDAFCAEHKITYYCAAGTVLGAIRHGGFIPWDDDIDILMTRSEFNRFADAFRKSGRKDRRVEYYEGNRGHHSTVARYVREDTSMFCHYHIMGDAAAGILIDIFILDPVPEGREEQMDMIAKFFVYADLAAPTLSYSNRLPDRYTSLIDRYLNDASCADADSAAMQLSEELFSYDEEECGCYLLRWGSIPFIYPKSFFGKPLKMRFEDSYIPVPSQWARYLAVHYGSRWYEIPYIEEQMQHSSVFSEDVDYHELYDFRDSKFSQDELIRLHRGMQAARRKTDALEKELEPFAAGMQMRICRKRIDEMKAEAGGASAAELFERGEYSSAVQIYRPYIALQTSMPFMGARKHGAMRHWIDPVVIPVEESELCGILRSLIFSGDTPPAEKIIGIYERAGMMTEELEKVRAVIDRIILAASACYYGDYEEALEHIRGEERWQEIPDLTEIYMLASVRAGISDEDAGLLERLASEEGAPAGIRKAYGDFLWEKSSRDAAEEIYHEVASRSRNGMFRKDIQDKGIQLAELSNDRPSAGVLSDAGICIRQMLAEIDDICREEDIRCIPGEELTQRLIRRRDPGEDPAACVILMDADGAGRFIRAFDKRRPEGRTLRSWLDGSNTEGFVLRYCAERSVYCDLRQSDVTEDHTIAVTIRILRSDASGAAYRKYIQAAETLAGKFGPKMSAKQAAFWRRLIFRRSLAGEKTEASKSYYYYAGRPGRRPSVKRVPADIFKDTVTVDSDGLCLPAAAVYAEKGHYPGTGPARSMFILKSVTDSPSELFTPKDHETYRSLPWAKYRDARKNSASYDGRVRDAWMQMRDGALEICEKGAKKTGADDTPDEKTDEK